MQCDLLTFVLIKLLVFAPLFNASKKHVLHYFALEMAAFVVARRMNRREQSVVEGRSFLHVLIYLECQNTTLSESDHILMLICTALGILCRSLWK